MLKWGDNAVIATNAHSCKKIIMKTSTPRYDDFVFNSIHTIT